MGFILQGTKAGPCGKIGIKLGPKSPPDGLNPGWAEQGIGPNVKRPLLVIALHIGPSMYPPLHNSMGQFATSNVTWKLNTIAKLFSRWPMQFLTSPNGYTTHIHQL